MRGTIGDMRDLIIGMGSERGGAAVDGPRQRHRGVVDGADRLLLFTGVEGFSGGLRGGCGGAGNGIREGGIGG